MKTILSLCVLIPVILSSQIESDHSSLSSEKSLINNNLTTHIVQSGIPLPISEDWSTGNYGTFWSPGDNWIINGQVGNDSPSAEFKWSPILQNYQQALESDSINGIYLDSASNIYIDGEFILSFDIKHDNVNATGYEYLLVEVWSDDQWTLVWQFNNAYGSFDWDHQEIDITDVAFGKVFKVRFLAKGDDSSDILSWYIDNILIERRCLPARYLSAEGAGIDEAILWWFTPEFPPESEWIHWDDGTHNGGIGLTGGGVFSVASHWDPDMIAQYDGQYITKIRFIPYANVVSTSFTLKVWSGANASNLLYEEPITIGAVSEWNEFTLGTPIMIDASQELWFGYTCDSPDGENPAGYDFGPAVAGYGDMITLDGVTWDPISSFGAQFDINWNLQALVNEVDDTQATTTVLKKNTIYSTPSAKPTSKQALNRIYFEEQENRSLIGYDIFWETYGTGYEYLDHTKDTFYTHYYQYFMSGEIYCYYVMAVYEDCEAISNEACWWMGGTEDNIAKWNNIEIFPNPTNDHVNVKSDIPIISISLLDRTGQTLIEQKDINHIQFTLDVSSLASGIYLLRIETEAGSVVRKVVVE